jgi:hypothetical protein
VFAPRLRLEYVQNLPPAVAILKPADGASAFAGHPVALAGSASDVEDGDLSAAIQWSSDLDGPIGAGAGFTTSALSIGTHSITASVADGAGLAGSDQVAIEIRANTPPAVAIGAPADGTDLFAGQAVAFAASASDAEEGDLSAGIQWSSDQDGPIGTGAGFSLASLTVGTHSITASVTDAGGLSGSDQVTLTVAANAPPAVAIATPDDGASLVAGQAAAFAASASDTEEGDLSAGIQWSSDLDGPIGAGGGFATSSLSPGVHTLEARATDSGGLQGSDQIEVAVLEAQPVPALPGWGLGAAGAGLLIAARRLLGAQSRRPTSRTSTKGSAAASPTRLPQ